MRTPTPDLDKLYEMHGTKLARFFGGSDDLALSIYETRISLKTGQHVDVSWVAIDQVVHAIKERGLFHEPSSYLMPPTPVAIALVTGADLRNEMSALPAASQQVETPAPPVEPKKGFWSRIAEAARG